MLVVHAVRNSCEGARGRLRVLSASTQRHETIAYSLFLLTKPRPHGCERRETAVVCDGPFLSTTLSAKLGVLLAPVPGLG
eukprot:216290-Prorocentrum_minimum.AAC.1